MYQMHGIYRDLGDIASAAMAADDVIDGSFLSDGPEDTFGLEIVHRGSRMNVTQSGGDGRFRVLTDFTPSVILRRGYSSEDVEQRANIDLETAEEQLIEEAVESMVRVDLQGAEEQLDTLVREMEQELSPIDTRYVDQYHDGSEVWNGFFFYDYLYPRENDFSTTRYREAVESVYQEAMVASKVARSELDILPDDSDGAVGTDESVSQDTSPAVH